MMRCEDDDDASSDGLPDTPLRESGDFSSCRPMYIVFKTVAAHQPLKCDFLHELT